jgi:hypothetical protein
MSDNRGWVYWDADANAYVYRASSLGSCIRSLTAARLGEDASPFNSSMRAAMDASSGLEDEIIRRFKIEMASDEVIWQQKEVELPVYLNYNTPTEPTVIVRGHLDGLYQLDDSILEIKALGDTNWNKYMGAAELKGTMAGLDALGTLGDKYRLQLGCYGHATERKVRLVVGHKVKRAPKPDSTACQISDGRDNYCTMPVHHDDVDHVFYPSWGIEEVDISPPMDPSDLYPLSDLHARIQFIEECAAKDELPECTSGCREGDPYSECHIFEGPQKGDQELETLLASYASVKGQIDDLSQRKDDIREAIIQSYGIGKWTAGPYSARIEHVKPTERLDTKRLRKEMPDVAAQYTTFGQPTIRLTVTGGKGD